MAHKCSSPGCAFSLPDKYPLDKCPWHLAPGKGFGGGMAYKKFRAYLRNRDKKRDAKRKKSASTQAAQKAASAAGKTSTTRTRKRTATKRKTVKATT